MTNYFKISFMGCKNKDYHGIYIYLYNGLKYHYYRRKVKIPFYNTKTT